MKSYEKVKYFWISVKIEVHATIGKKEMRLSPAKREDLSTRN